MGTRFLMTADSPVPKRVLERYLAIEDPAAIRVSAAVDGLPQRLIGNDALRRIEGLGAVKRLGLGLRHGLEWGRRSGMSMPQMLSLALRMAFGDRIGFSQTVMAATAPALIQEALRAGDPDHGLLPSGQIAAIIDDLPSCTELIQEIVGEAERRLQAAGRLPASLSGPAEVRDE